MAGPSSYLRRETQDQRQLDSPSRQPTTNHMISFPSERSAQQARPALHPNVQLDALLAGQMSPALAPWDNEAMLLQQRLASNQKRTTTERFKGPVAGSRNFDKA